MYEGTVLQHLVGAKLVVLEMLTIDDCQGANVADLQTDRSGDFTAGDAAIHVTTRPTAMLIEKCQNNNDAAVRPIIVTTDSGIAWTTQLATDAGLDDRIEIVGAEQFIATNILERGRFVGEPQVAELRQLVDTYNAIIDAVESDPSLRIEVASH